MNRQKITLTLMLLAGLMDTIAGLLLIGAPGFALRLMLLDPSLVDLAYQRFIGAFVFGVGTLYLWSWQRGRFGDWATLSTLWIATAWMRLCVGCVTLGLVSTGSIEWLWVSVTVSDLGLGAFQIWWKWSGKLAR